MLHNATLYKTQVSSNAKSPSSIEGIRTVGQKSPAHPRALASTRVHVIFLLVTCSVFEQIHFGEVLASRRTKKTKQKQNHGFHNIFSRYCSQFSKLVSQVQCNPWWTDHVINQLKWGPQKRDGLWQGVYLHEYQVFQNKKRSQKRVVLSPGGFSPGVSL